ncbi:MAG: BPL-N domain-containing protein [Fermentimonas sp.]|jgi:glutamine amidotransferase-like uncharacterized protein
MKMKVRTKTKEKTKLNRVTASTYFPLLLTLWCFFLYQCDAPGDRSDSPDTKILVGVFDGHGSAQTCVWETVASIRLDPEMNVRTITSADIAMNVLDSLDALIIPGGGGSRQFLNLGEENHNRIRKFVADGKGAVGICAGAYLFSSTPGYSCLQLNGAKAIDIEHDNRGHGVAKFTLTDEGKRLFPEIADRDTSYVIYYEGPVFVNNEPDTIEYQTYAIMESDVHEEGNAPKNMTNGKPFFTANQFGKGRVFSSIAHPEATPGMMWMIPRMVRWTLAMPIIEYTSEAVKPDLFEKEILMSFIDLREESKCFDTFLYGTPEQKLEALDWLQLHLSWSAKRWVQGLLYDGNPEVRLRAAKYIADTQYLHYLPDLKAAWLSEQDAEIKEKMEEQYTRVLNLITR